MPRIDISATDIRARIAAGKSIRYLVPESVRTYIEMLKLYLSHYSATWHGAVRVNHCREGRYGITWVSVTFATEHHARKWSGRVETAS